MRSEQEKPGEVIEQHRADRLTGRAVSAAEGGLRYTYRLTRSMVQMLDHLCIRTVRKPVSRQGLIDAASRLFCPNEDALRLVAQQLRRREAMGDIYIKPLFALLHCRTKAVSDRRFGYLQAQPPVYEAGKMIIGAFVLLAPDTDDPIPVEVMRMVSAQLIERLRTSRRAAALIMWCCLSIKGVVMRRIFCIAAPFARRTEFTGRMCSCDSLQKQKGLFVEITD